MPIPFEAQRDGLGFGGVSRRAVLVGAGHAHLHVIHQAHRFANAGIELVLISPPTFLYSGLATAVLSGALPREAHVIDVQDLARACGVRYICDTVQAVDRGSGHLRLTEGAFVEFDAISFNVGSIVDDPNMLATSLDVWTVKPLERVLELRLRVEADLTARRRCPSIVIAGGGQTAFEVAAALCGLCERAKVRPNITVVGEIPEIQWAPPAATRRLVESLQDRGVVVVPGRVIARGPKLCALASGRQLDCKALVLATGLAAPALMEQLDLAVDHDGRLLTSKSLQALDDRRVFAAGDCGVVQSDPRPCVGVFGVRAGPVLAGNLLAFISGGRLATFRPQRRWLSIMDLGDGTGLALRGRAWWMGRAALRLKRHLDRGFVRSTQRHPVRLRGDA
jgi:NADH dehydrogenase FAD-containing subunit